MLYKANDNYNSNLSQSYTVGDTTLYVDAVPDNAPTIVVVDYGGDDETVFSVTGKTSNSLTGVARIRGANVNIDNATAITCLNNEDFINQFISTGLDPWYDESDGATIEFDIVNGVKQRVTIAGNRTLDITGVTPGQVMYLRIKQDGTGGRTITWDAGLTITWGTENSINSGANEVTTYLFIQTATDTYDAYKLNTSANGLLTVAGTASGGAEIRLYEDTDNGSNYVGMKAPASIASNKTFILPATDGNAGDSLNTDGAGNLSFGSTDWRTYSTVVPTSGTLDDPSFPIVFAGVDLTSILSVGMRVRITQSTVKYFIITKVEFSTNTTVTLYGGTDYDLVATGTTAISAFAYSGIKAPVGFPIDPLKWTQTVTNTGDNSQGTPTNGTWYNLGTVSIDLPIGAWDVEYFCTIQINDSTAATYSVVTTLSTANNTESDSQFSAYSQIRVDTAGAAHHTKRKNVSVTAETPLYLNSKTLSNSVDTLFNIGSTAPIVIRAICALL